MGRSRRMRRTWGWHIGVALVKPVLLVVTRRTWRGTERLPKRGGFVVVANHVSHLDPLTLAHFMLDNGYEPSFLAKDALFDVFFVKSVMRSTGQIPVARESSNAGHAYVAAVDGVKAGKAVVFYPEGTLTRDPELWPMVGKTGAARVALEADVPVIPIVQWGVHEVLYPYAKRPDLWPPKEVVVEVGEPVDLDDLRGQPLTPELLLQASERIMRTLAQQLAAIRQQPAPSKLFDPKAAGVPNIGNPHAGAGPATRQNPAPSPSKNQEPA